MRTVVQKPVYFQTETYFWDRASIYSKSNKTRTVTLIRGIIYSFDSFFNYLVALIPGPPAAASHRRTAWHGDHGMACMVAHRRARRGAADLIESGSLSDYCTAEG